MPNRRKQNALAQSPRSASSSPASHKEYNVLKELVEDLKARLEILERVFVFVDFDEINTVVAAYKAQSASDYKAGADRIFATCERQPLHASEELVDQRVQTAPVDLHDGIRAKSLIVEQDARAGLMGHVTRNREILQESDAALGRQRDVIAGLEEAVDACMSLNDIQTQEGFVNLVDDVELKSTCSTWDICSTKDMENEIEPELFHKFMKQALRPRWHKETDQQQSENGSPQRKSCLRQGAASSQRARSSLEKTAVEAELDEMLESALLE